MKYLFLLDYDGTLSPIVGRPEKATLTKKQHKILEALSQSKTIKIAIVTGRSLKSIKSLVQLPQVIYIGNHGFEIEFKGKKITQAKAKKTEAIINRIVSQLKKELKDIKGIVLENKKFTASLHYRLVKESKVKRVKQIFNATVKPYRKKLRITQGKKVIEIRPPFNWHKGKAVLWLLKRFDADYLPIYIGDDTTDEDAFKALKNKGITIRVGPKKKTAAQLRIDNVAEVYRFLSFLQSSRKFSKI